MIIVEKPKERFTQIPNEVHFDKQLCDAERGMLFNLFFLSGYRVNGVPWDYSDRGYAERLGCKVSSVITTRKKLMKNGWFHYPNGLRNERGRFGADVKITIPDRLKKSVNAKSVSDDYACNEQTIAKKPLRKNGNGETGTDEPLPLNGNGETGAVFSEHNNTVIQELSVNTSPNKNVGVDTVSQSINTGDERMKEINAYKSIVAQNIHLESLKQTASTMKSPCEAIDKVDEIYELICHVVNFTKDTYRVDKQMIPGKIVKSQFLKLKNDHIRRVLNNYPLTGTIIENPRNYLIAMLYNESLHSTLSEEQEVLLQDDGMLACSQEFF